MEARTASAVLNMSTSPFVLNALQHVQLAQSNHVFPCARRVFGWEIAFFVVVVISERGICLNPPSKTFFFFPPFLENENQGYFWLFHSTLSFIIPFQGKKKKGIN